MSKVKEGTFSTDTLSVISMSVFNLYPNALLTRQNRFSDGTLHHLYAGYCNAAAKKKTRKEGDDNKPVRLP